MRILNKLKISNIKIKIRELSNPYLGPIRRRFLKCKNFTIISNNCWGGAVYRYFALPYNTPTVGLYFFANDYVRFVSNLKKYIDSELEFITIEESKHKEELLKIGGNSLKCPIGKLLDVEIIFLHYKSTDEARTKWNRRCKRIFWDNVIVKFSEMNNCSEEDLRNFNKIPYKKICFVTRNRGYESEILFKQFAGKKTITDDTTNFKRYLNLTKLINK